MLPMESLDGNLNSGWASVLPGGETAPSWYPSAAKANWGRDGGGYGVREDVSKCVYVCVCVCVCVYDCVGKVKVQGWREEKDGEKRREEKDEGKEMKR